jgi:transglutaminase-like putative cysteine protease
VRIGVTHNTCYAFVKPVFLEPHVIRLVPRGDAGQRLISLAADIAPEPAGRSLVTDMHGNTVLSVWFSGVTERLVVTTRIVVETLRQNPFDYLIDASGAKLPVPLSPAEAAAAAPCLALPPGPPDGCAALAARLRREGAATPQVFALALLAWMHERLATTLRHEPGILSPDEVLSRGAGACRDLAVFFLTACRHVGIPARFASGYHEGDPDSEDRDLHAWAEAYVPGGGWRGFDPSLGLAVSDRHVVLAAAPDPEDAAPVAGTFRGEGKGACLTHGIRLEVA